MHPTETTGWNATRNGAWNPAPQPQRKTWKDIAPSGGMQWGVEEPHNFAKQFAAATGFGGNPLMQGGPGRMVEGESGSFMEPGSDWNITPEFQSHLDQYSWESGASGKNQHPWLKAFDAQGNPVAGGQQFTIGDNGSRSYDAAMKAAMVAALGYGGMQAFGGAGLDPMTTDLGGFGTSGGASGGASMGAEGAFGDLMNLDFGAAMPNGVADGSVINGVSFPAQEVASIGGAPYAPEGSLMGQDAWRAAELAGGGASGGAPSGVNLGELGGIMPASPPNFLDQIKGVLSTPMKDMLPPQGTLGATLLQGTLPAVLGKLGGGGGPPGFFMGGGGTGGGVGGGGGSGAGGVVDPLTTNQAMIDAIVRQNNRYLDPQKAEEWQSLEGRLAAQGFVQGTPAYAQAKDQFERTWERRYADARDRAITQGNLTGFNQALQSNQNAFDQLFRRSTADYNSSLNNYNAKVGQRNDLTKQISDLMAVLYLGGG